MDNNEFIEKKIDQLVKRKNLKGKKIILFGTTSASKTIRDRLLVHGYSVYAVIDNFRVADRLFMGMDVYKPDELLLPYSEDYFIIICSRFKDVMARQLADMGYKKQVYCFYWNLFPWKCGFKTLVQCSKLAADGLKTYKSIEKKYPGYKIFLAPYSGLGDMYLLGLYFFPYIEKEHIEKYVFVVSNTTCKKVAKMFGIQNIEVISINEAEELCKAKFMYGEERMPISILNTNMVPSNKVRYLRGYHGLNFADEFRTTLFGLDDDVEMRHPVLIEDGSYVKELFEKYKLKPGKTVIIAPYANTLYNLPEEVLEDLAKKLKERGFTVCTNSGGSSEPVIKGTCGVFFPIERMKECCDYAGYFIGARSGLCDLICRSNCKKIILYAKSGYFTFATQLEYFSLNGMKFCDDAIELEFEETKEGYERLEKEILEEMRDGVK